jgi:hypothetical protein
MAGAAPHRKKPTDWASDFNDRVNSAGEGLCIAWQFVGDLGILCRLCLEILPGPNTLDLWAGRFSTAGTPHFSELFRKGNRMNVHSSPLARVSRSFLTALSALLVGSLLTTSSAQAQANGYDFGIGWGFAQPGIRFTTPREDLPYFAKFPPVYYGDMVRRPYGYSPYALPPGIEPVEQRVIEQSMGPRTIVNPFFDRRAMHARPIAPVQNAVPAPAEMAPPAAAPPAESAAPADPAAESVTPPAIDDRDVAA